MSVNAGSTAPACSPAAIGWKDIAGLLAAGTPAPRTAYTGWRRDVEKSRSRDAAACTPNRHSERSEESFLVDFCQQTKKHGFLLRRNDGLGNDLASFFPTPDSPTRRANLAHLFCTF